MCPTIPRGLALLLWLSAVSYLGADEPGAPTPAQKYGALVKAQRQAQQQFSKAYTAAKTDEQRQSVLKEFGAEASPTHYSGKFLALIRNHPKDPTALDAFLWMARWVRYGRDTNQAVEAVLTHWIEDERLAKVCKSLLHYDGPATTKLLRRAIAKSPHRTVQGYARFSLAVSLRKKTEQMINASPKDRKPLELEAEQLLQEVIDKYSDLKHFPTILGKAAEAELFGLRRLAIGKTAPDIQGKDVDGKKMKLSDFRGKVVLLKFWGTW